MASSKRCSHLENNYFFIKKFYDNKTLFRVSGCSKLGSFTVHMDGPYILNTTSLKCFVAIKLFKIMFNQKKHGFYVISHYPSLYMARIHIHIYIMMVVIIKPGTYMY